MAKEKKFSIYALTDPQTGEIRYIGKTEVGLSSRLQKHINPCALKPKTHKNDWIKNLKKLGVTPNIVLINENVNSREQLNYEEQWWIAKGHQIGLNLTNATWGGDGSIGLKQTEESKRKISAANLGRVHTPETRAKVSLAGKGRLKSGEHKKKIGDANKGKIVSPESGRKISAAKKGKPVFLRRMLIIDQDGVVYHGQIDASQKLGIPVRDISAVICGEQKSARGYKFKKLEDK